MYYYTLISNLMVIAAIKKVSILFNSFIRNIWTHGMKADPRLLLTVSESLLQWDFLVPCYFLSFKECSATMMLEFEIMHSFKQNNI